MGCSAATGIGLTSATFHGAAQWVPAGYHVYFEYGVQGQGFTYQTPSVTAPGVQTMNVAATVNNLECGTEYCYRLVAVDPATGLSHPVTYHQVIEPNLNNFAQTGPDTFTNPNYGGSGLPATIDFPAGSGAAGGWDFVGGLINLHYNAFPMNMTLTIPTAAAGLLVVFEGLNNTPVGIDEKIKSINPAVSFLGFGGGMLTAGNTEIDAFSGSATRPVWVDPPAVVTFGQFTGNGAHNAGPPPPTDQDTITFRGFAFWLPSTEPTCCFETEDCTWYCGKMFPITDCEQIDLEGNGFTENEIGNGSGDYFYCPPGPIINPPL